MKKYIKCLIVLIAAFFFLEGSVMATTILETTKDDNYDTILEGSMIIGVTKFDSDVVLTASRVAKAGANDATLYVKKNNGVDGYKTPTIYVYYGIGGWYELDDDNNAIMVTDEDLIDMLSYQEIYYVNNVEKKIDVSLDGISINEEKLPDGVLLQNDKLLVNATLSEFVVYTTDDKKITYSYAEDIGAYVVNNSVCYQSEDGYITGYSDECVKDITLPERLNGEQIVGVKANAFDNKGITSVVIGENIMHLEDNAFANNPLESVIVKEKYDKTDFTTYGNNVFGDFKEDSIIYDNDLTRLLNKFNDENVIKVKKGLSLEKWETEKILMHNETQRLNIKENEIPEYAGDGMPSYVYDSKLYNINLCYDNYCTSETLNDNELILNISLVDDSNKSVSKKITYEIEEVDVGDEIDQKINNASDAIEEYLTNTNEKFMSGNYNIALFNKEEVEKILSNNGLCGIYIGSGDGDSNNPIEVTDKISITNDGGDLFLLLSNDVVIDTYFEISHYTGVTYDATNIEGEYENIDDKIDAAISEFEEEVKPNEYLINMNGDLKYRAVVIKDDNSNIIVRYSVYIIDVETNNSWYIILNEKEEEPLISNTSSSMQNGVLVQNTNYSYYPNISFEDYDSTEAFKNAAIEKLANKVGVSNFDDYSVSLNLLPGTSCEEVDGNYECKYTPNEDGIYEYRYTVNLSPKQGVVDGKLTTYTINLYKYLDYEITNNDTGIYEVDINPNDYVGKADEYKNVAISMFASENNITDYGFLDGNDSYYFSIKDVENNTFSQYNEPVSSDSVNIYMTYQVKDYSKEKTWFVYVPYNLVIYSEVSN